MSQAKNCSSLFSSYQNKLKEFQQAQKDSQKLPVADVKAQTESRQKVSLITKELGKVYDDYERCYSMK